MYGLYKTSYRLLLPGQVRVRPMEQLLERNVRVDDGFKLNISEEACDERVSRLLTDIRETLDKRLRSERGVDDDNDDVVIVGEEWNVDPLGDAGPAEERPKGEVSTCSWSQVTPDTWFRRKINVNPSQTYGLMELTPSCFTELQN